MPEDKKIDVIPAGEFKDALNGLQGDIVELKRQMDEDKEATGLKIEERADDLQKALTAAEDFSKRLEEIDRKTQTAMFNASFSNTGAELKAALQVYQGGFLEMTPDGSPIEHPAGSKPSFKHLMEGVYLKSGDNKTSFYAPQHETIRDLQKAADDVYVVDAMLRVQMDNNDLHEYNNRGGAKSLKTYARFSAMAQNFSKAVGDLIDTATEVVNWIPTQWSSQLYEQVKLGLPLVNMFPEITMTSATMNLPLDMNDNEAMRVTETTTLGTSGAGQPWNDANFVNPAAFSSKKITLNAEKLRSRYWLSAEADEDTIVAMLPLLNQKHRRNMGEALEDAILNGQPSALDTGGTHFSKTNPSASTDARDCWDGLRYHANACTASPSPKIDHSAGDLTVAGLRGMRGGMGEYGTDPNMIAYILGPWEYIALLSDTPVATVEKFGPQATVRTGVLAIVDGCDVVVSRRMPQNANASGVIDGVTETRTMAIAVHRESAILGNRRRITLASQSWVSSDTTELVAFWRGDWQPVYQNAGTPITTVPWVGVLYNVAAT